MNDDRLRLAADRASPGFATRVVASTVARAAPRRWRPTWWIAGLGAAVAAATVAVVLTAVVAQRNSIAKRTVGPNRVERRDMAALQSEIYTLRRDIEQWQESRQRIPSPQLLQQLHLTSFQPSEL